MDHAGEDIIDQELANQIPSVMAQFGEGDSAADYKDMKYPNSK